MTYLQDAGLDDWPGSPVFKIFKRFLFLEIDNWFRSQESFVAIQSVTVVTNFFYVCMPPDSKKNDKVARYTQAQMIPFF